MNGSKNEKAVNEAKPETESIEVGLSENSAWLCGAAVVIVTRPSKTDAAEALFESVYSRNNIEK